MIRPWAELKLQAVTCQQQVQLPSHITDWLLYPGSLTQKLRDCFHDEIKVDVIFEGEERPTLLEAEILGCNTEQLVFIREVKLFSGCSTFIIARTVIPLSSLTDEWSRLQDLQNTALGDVLFHMQSVSREIIGLEQEQDDKEQRFVRNSLFTQADKKLLVRECFLPRVWEV